MPKVVFLGTNGWYDSETGNTVSILIQCDNYNIILDAGSGFAKVYRFIDYNKPTFLFLSHFHLDHIIGLHTLQLNNFTKGLTFIVQENGTEILNNILQRPFTTPLAEMPFKYNILEIQNCNILPFNAEFFQMQHSVKTYGIKLTIDNKVIAYTADTGYCANVQKLAEGTDLLIAECAFKPGETYTNSPHLNPEQAGEIAQLSGAKKLYLIHFDARRYPSIASRQDALQKTKAIFPESYIAEDGITIDI